ncbi:MAG TPA: ABC transporter substrate-binding protein [Alphaproteobacteria bacterium]|nr:ABC transporter substrate-binding protein [Alphaproteobacteria bacterium]
MTFTRRSLTIAASAAALVFACTAAQAEKKYGPGASDTEIKIGNTNPYSGPASAYGTIGKAIAAYFAMINDEGGINGRKINFISLDDGYSPPKTVEQTRRLVEEDKVLLDFQPLGTPCNTAIQPYMNEQKVPQLFVATGATKWNNPKQFPWTMGWQPNYQTESRIYAAYILKNIPDAKIAILYQNDDYGKDYVKGMMDGLGDKAAKMVVAQKSYETTDPTVDSQIVALKGSGANVFFNVTTPKFASQAIRKAYDIGWKQTQFLNNVSNSVSAVLQPAGLEKSAGIISSGYYKDPADPKWQQTQAYKDWLAWMKKYLPNGNLGDAFNVYGYTVAQTMVHVLKQAGDDLTRENIMKQAASLKSLELPMLLPGIKISTGPDDFAPLKQMQLMKFDGKAWQLFGEVLSAEGS